MTGRLGAKEGIHITFGRDGVQDAGMCVELMASFGAALDTSTDGWEGKIHDKHATQRGCMPPYT